MKEEDGVHQLLFELSNSRRTEILTLIQRSHLRMQQIARQLEMTATEAFRHLQRLSSAELIRRDSNGFYSLTPLGRLTLSMLSGLFFVSKYREYFLEHTTTQLPMEFEDRLGELTAGTLSTDVLANLNRVEKMTKEAGEYVWTMTEQVSSSNVQIMIERLKKGVRLRFLFAESLLSTVGTVPGLEHMIERRYLPKLPAGILLTEKEGFVTLPLLSGKVDYTGFSGSDRFFRKWSSDLFQHYWQEAKLWHPGLQTKSA